MAWSNTTQNQFFPMQRREGGYVAFGSDSTTVNVYTWMTKIHTIKLTYKASGNSCLFDEPLTAAATVSSGYFVVTRPSTCGGASSIWYEIVGE